MSYAHIWKKVVNDDEVVTYEFSIGKGYLWYNMILWTVVSLPIMFVPLLITRIEDNPIVLIISATGFVFFLAAFFNFGFYLRVANAYAFTTKRVLIHRGWLSTHTTSIPYHKITDVSVTEPFIERMMTRTGQISINTAGSHKHEVLLRHISNPYETKKQLDRARDKYRSEQLSAQTADLYEQN